MSIEPCYGLFLARDCFPPSPSGFLWDLSMKPLCFVQNPQLSVFSAAL